VDVSDLAEPLRMCSEGECSECDHYMYVIEVVRSKQTGAVKAKRARATQAAVLIEFGLALAPLLPAHQIASLTLKSRWGRLPCLLSTYMYLLPSPSLPTRFSWCYRLCLSEPAPVTGDMSCHFQLLPSQSSHRHLPPFPSAVFVSHGQII